MTDRDEMFSEWEAQRALYLDQFAVEAPEYMPMEIPEGIDDLKEAMKTGVALEVLPEGTVT